MKRIKCHHIAIAYLLAAIFAYGHAYNNCPDTTYNGWTGRMDQTSPSDRVMTAFLSSTFWPLYLSVKIQETKT